MTHQEYSKSVLSIDSSTRLRDASTDYLNISSTEVMEATQGIGGIESILVGDFRLAGDGSKKKQHSTSHISTQRRKAGWIFPEWQISRHENAEMLPTITPFSNLPPDFALRVNQLHCWVAPHVNRKIFELVEANALIHNFGNNNPVDGVGSTFVEHLHSLMRDSKKKTTNPIETPSVQPITVKCTLD